MPMLPYEFSEEMPEFDPNRFETPEIQRDVWDAIGDYAIGSGWSQEQWFDMIQHVTGYYSGYDENGEYYAHFDFDWASEDGQYQGYGSV